MRDLKHILLPTDFSVNSREALPAASALARRSGATLHLLHVATPPPTSVQEAARKTGMALDGDELRAGFEAELRELASLIDGVTVETHVVEGDSAAEELARFVTEHQVDLVAIATMGQTGLKRFLLGSTTEKVCRTAPCPVLVTRATTRPWDELERILVPTDFSELSLVALDEAVELARVHEAEVVLAHVLEETGHPTGRMLKGHGMLDPEEQLRNAVRTQLEELQRERIAAPVTSRVLLQEGVPSPAVAGLATQEDADLIVIASHARQGLARFVLGSTAERTVRIAPCSVLVVKERGR